MSTQTDTIAVIISFFMYVCLHSSHHTFERHE